MPEFTITPLELSPYFDLELLMMTSQETRIAGDMMGKLTTAWERWVGHAHACRIEGAGSAYLLVWLDDSVEEEVDDVWEETPSEAFLYNALAQVMCMGMVHAAIPQVEELGCAPAPPPTDLLADALETEGISYAVMGEPGLTRRYAVVTYYPFRGGCELCCLRQQCPKAGSSAGTVVLGR